MISWSLVVQSDFIIVKCKIQFHGQGNIALLGSRGITSQSISNDACFTFKVPHRVKSIGSSTL